MEDSLTTETDAPLDGASIETEAPADDVAVVEGQADGGEAPAEPNILNLDEYQGHVVTIGDEQVPIEELQGGYLRQADYTRKTQELAEQRTQLENAATLQRALEANPQRTLEFLAEQYGVQFAQQVADAATSDADGWDGLGDEPTAPNPLETRLAALEAEREAERAQREVEQAFSGLEAKYGEDFNRTEVAKAAWERGIYDPNMFEMVYKDLAFDRVRARTDAEAAAAAAAQAEQAARQAAAAEAAAATGGGASAAGTTSAAPARHLTLTEAARAAAAELQSAGRL